MPREGRCSPAVAGRPALGNARGQVDQKPLEEPSTWVLSNLDVVNAKLHLPPGAFFRALEGVNPPLDFWM